MSKLITKDLIEKFDDNKRLKGVSLFSRYPEMTGAEFFSLVDKIEIDIEDRIDNFYNGSMTYKIVGKTIVPTFGDRYEDTGFDYLFKEEHLYNRFDYVEVFKLINIERRLMRDDRGHYTGLIEKGKAEIKRVLEALRNEFHASQAARYLKNSSVRGLSVAVYWKNPFMDNKVDQIIEKLQKS